MIFKRYPRISIGVLSVLLFAAGFFYEQFSERERVQTLVESSQQADKNFQDLTAAYELRLNTVHSLVALALQHKTVVPSALVLVLEGLDAKSEVGNSEELHEFQSQQASLGAGVHDLIAAMDADLPPAHAEFGKLLKEFESQERNLSRLQNGFAEQANRVRALARKGDRKLLAPGLRLPASTEEGL